MSPRKDAIRTLLKGIETGDPAAAAVVNEARYIQHNPQTAEGSEGLAALFARLAKTNPKVTVVRLFEDGDFVFGHTEYDFATRRIGFEVFRFDGHQAVEHWDNIQPRQGPNRSGRSMVDGPVGGAADGPVGGPVAADIPARTEASRALIRAFTEEILIGQHLDRLGDFVAEDLIEHAPDGADGIASLRATLRPGADPALCHHRLHRVLAEGDFALAVCEGTRDHAHTAFYDLYRIDTTRRGGARIAERWNTVEAVPPPEAWKNTNGKF